MSYQGRCSEIKDGLAGESTHDLISVLVQNDEIAACLSAPKRLAETVIYFTPVFDLVVFQCGACLRCGLKQGTGIILFAIVTSTQGLGRWPLCLLRSAGNHLHPIAHRNKTSP